MNLLHSLTSRFLDLIAGTEPRQRLRLTRSLSATLVYIMCVVLQFAGVSIGLADLPTALVFSASLMTGQLIFYVALRSGWSLRWQDPALTMPQMVFAIISVALAYAAYPPVRGMMATIMALVLVFGAFILPPQRCRQLGWAAVTALVLVILMSSMRNPQAFDPRIESYHILLSALVLPLIARLAGELSGLRAQQQTQKLDLREALDKLQLLATHDELTGLPNRRHMLTLMQLEERKALRQPAPLCLCLIDIDHFKEVNDTLGHPTGDQALQVFARIMCAAIRPGDVLARWGGEEFMLLLPDTPIDEAVKTVERLRTRCADVQAWGVHPELRVTFSAGMSAHLPVESVQLAIGRADAALYIAKNSGRNCVKVV
jgi:diguanylate cyclase